jgi:hypothetical protein
MIDALMKQGKISIGRRSTSDTDLSGKRIDTIHIELEDAVSGLRMFDIELDMENFAQAVTGLSCIPCSFKLGAVDKVGMKREVKEETVPIMREKNVREDPEAWAEFNCKPFMVDGWKPRAGDFGNWHRRVTVSDTEAYTVTFIRFV